MKLVNDYVQRVKARISYLPLLPLVVILAVASPAVADDLTDARRAYAAGEFEEAATLLKPLARAGQVEALFLLGRMYEQGDGVSKDLSEARRLFKSAADKGHKDAKQRLAVFGNGDTGDESVVLNWYLPAAKDGDVEAQYNLGFMYETGWGVRANEKEAVKWYRDAADGKHDMAQLRLGMMYITGAGLPQDNQLGVELLRRSAENGNRVAEVLVQELYDTGEADALNAAKIIAGLRRVIDDGETKALKSLNASLDAARGKKRNGKDESSRTTVRREREVTPPVKAPVLKDPPTKESADEAANSEESPRATFTPTKPSSSLSEAQLALGKAIEQERGGEVDNGDIVRRYLAAARQGNPDAQFNLGILYVQGRGLTKDLQEGLRWFRQAANQGHELSKDYLSLWSNELDNASFGSTIAVIWLKEAARDWNTDALFHLGYVFETGRGVKINTNEAKIWYQLAAEGGNLDARRRLDLLQQGRPVVETANTHTATQPLASTVASNRWNWFNMMAIFIGIALATFAVFYFWRKANGSGPSPINTGLAANPFADKAAVEKALAQDDIEFLKGLWDEKPAGPAVEAAPARREKIEMPVEAMSRRPRSQTESAGAAPDEKKPIIVEDDIKLPDLKAVLGVKEDQPGGSEKQAGHVEPAKKQERTPPRVEPAPKPEPQIELLDQETPPKKAGSREEASSRMSAPTSKADFELIPPQHRFEADQIASSGISRDALAAARISADRLVEDGLVLDKAGRVVAKNEEPAPKPEQKETKSQAENGLFDLSTIDIASLRKSRESLAELAGKSPISSAPTKEAISRPVNRSDAAPPPSPPPKAPEPPPAVTADDEERSLGEVHYNIAIMFANGDGVPKNDTMAAKWFRKAADEGHVVAQFTLGEMYLAGRGIQQNPNLGISWIQKAADAGYRPAIERLQKHQAG